MNNYSNIDISRSSFSGIPPLFFYLRLNILGRQEQSLSMLTQVQNTRGGGGAPPPPQVPGGQQQPPLDTIRR